MGYYAMTETNASADCNVICQLQKVVEPVKQYLPYIAVGAIGLIILVMFMRRKSSAVDKKSSAVGLFKRLLADEQNEK